MMADTVTLSREFRSLVAAIRGPLDEELADRTASAARRERIKTLDRNFTRLLHLVNTLFDLSQNEARHHGTDLVDSGATTLIIPTLREGGSPTERMPIADILDEE
jgi:signal transduction histidine kinase